VKEGERRNRGEKRGETRRAVRVFVRYLNRLGSVERGKEECEEEGGKEKKMEEPCAARRPLRAYRSSGVDRGEGEGGSKRGEEKQSDALRSICAKCRRA